MHNWMPQSAASARMKLDDALLELHSAQRQVTHGQAHNKDDLLALLQQAIVHIEAAMEALA